jgi:aminopeptidase 2
MVISLEINKETSTLVFNTSALDLGDILVFCETAQEKEQVVSSRDFDTVAERATLRFACPFPAGSKAQLRVTFRGELTGSMLGYYKSSWEHEGTKKYYALTQFEVRSHMLVSKCISFVS